LSRFAKDRRVFFIEEPVFHDAQSGFDVSKRDDGLHVVVPRLQSGMPQHEIEGQLRSLIDRMVDEQQIEEYVSWYYTPMMLGWSRH
jgi:UDP-galactopyranose mutase